jgi:hypothetical protein
MPEILVSTGLACLRAAIPYVKGLLGRKSP